MPVFQYKALSHDGKAETGVVDADSPKEARLKLKGRRLHVTDLDALTGKQSKEGKKGASRKIFFRRRRPEEVAMLTRQLATLLGSSIPMIGAFTAVIDQCEHLDLKSALMDIREQISQGSTMSDALESHPHFFSELYVNMVRAGEAGGNLDTVLARVAEYLHNQNRNKSKVMAALTYPLIMLIIGGGVVIVLLAFVVPKMMEVIEEQGAALPLPTEILLGISNFVQAYWWLLLAGFFVLGGIYMRARQTPGGKLWIDTNVLKIPLIGKLIRKASVSRFAMTFATLLESGLPVLEAMSVVRKVVDNALLANALEDIRKKVAEGADIATPLKNSKIFPPVVGYMVAVGEESGRLEELLKKTAEAYDEEVEIASQKMTAMLEPVMIVFMAAIVGFIVMAILLPIIQMSNL